jgi:hypothetical protein
MLNLLNWGLAMRRNILQFTFVHIVANGLTTANKGKCKMVGSGENQKKHYLVEHLDFFFCYSLKQQEVHFVSLG